MADASTLEVEPQEREQLVFQRRQLLRFPGLGPGVRYSLPFFLHHEDGVPVFTKIDGSLIMYCVDPEYQSLDHCLLWLDFLVSFDDASTTGEQASATIYCYFGGDQPALERWDGCKPSECKATPGMPQPLEDVFLVADYFNGGECLAVDGDQEHAFGVPPGWELHAGPEKAVGLAPVDSLQPGQHFLKPLGSALQLSVPLAERLPMAGAASMWPMESGTAGVMLRRPVRGLWSSPRTRLHLRVRFQDNMADDEPQSHWVGMSSGLGTGAVGLAPQFPEHYAFVNGGWHTGEVPRFLHKRWEKTGVRRSQGWHLFEITLELGQLSITIDGEPLYTYAARDTTHQSAVWLASECGGCGNWIGVELLQTPLGRSTWETGLQQPWEVISYDECHWMLGGNGVLEQLPLQELTGSSDEEDAPAKEEEEVEQKIKSRGVRQKRGAKPAAGRARKSPGRPRSRRGSRSRQFGGLTIECWALPDETDLARLDRIIGMVLDQLREASVPMPTNFQRVGECEEPQHEKCFVFSFGTRRLHISMREGAGGTVTLAVRVGGGYMDLIEFIHKNGALEQLRWQQAQGSGSDSHHARFCSVLSKGRRKVKEMS